MSTHNDSNMFNEFSYPLLYNILENLVSVQKMRQTNDYKRLKTAVLYCVEQLLSHMDRVNNNSQDNSNTLLHLAAKTESTEILEMLLLKGAHVNAQNHDLETPLHLALENNETSVVQLLMRNGADPKIINKDDYSSFHFLIKFCGESMINIFIENGVPFDFHLSSGKQFLEFAVANNSVQMVQLVFDHSDKLKEEDIKGSTLLHEAVKNKNIEILKLLLKNGFNVNATSDSGATPLQIAVKQKLEDIIPVLLDNNANVNCKDDSGVSILHHAVNYEYSDLIKKVTGIRDYMVDNITCSYSKAITIVDEGFKKILKLLLEHGANVKIKDTEGYMPIHRAVEKSKKEFVLLLVEKGGYINVTTNGASTLMHLLANTYSSDHNDDTDYLSKFFLENGANLKARNEYGMTPLDNAVDSENLKLVRDILDKNPDPNDNDNKLSFCLSFIEYSDDYYDECFNEYSTIQSRNERTAAEEFVERGFTICMDDFKDVYVPAGFRYQVKDKFASSEFRTTVFNILNKKEVTDPTEVVKVYMEYIVLIGSIKRGFTSIVDTLLTPVVNINVPLHTGMTLLHVASNYGHLSFVKELLKRGADVNAVDSSKMSALHFSVIRDHANIAELLLKNQAIIEARNDENQTSLFWAVREKSYKCIKLLLNFGANINFVDVHGKSPLHAAVDNNDILSVKILLHYGAICNKENFRPLFDTESYISLPSIKIIKILFDHGAKMIGLDKHVSKKTCAKFIIKSIAANVDSLLFPKPSKYKDFQIKCQEEIEKMKLIGIDGFDVSIYEFLVNDERKIATYMRNKKIVGMLDLMDFENVFPIFSSKLRICVMKGKRLNRLVELCYHCLEVIFKLKIPVVVINEIFSYLEERDLRSLIIAAPIDSEMKASIQYKE